jgi:hypothetical protein
LLFELDELLWAEEDELWPTMSGTCGMPLLSVVGSLLLPVPREELLLESRGPPELVVKVLLLLLLLLVVGGLADISASKP